VNGGETIQGWPRLKRELIEREILARPLWSVGVGIERMWKKVKQKLALGRRAILKRFESGVVDGV